MAKEKKVETTEELIDWLKKYADSGIPFHRWYMVTTTANRLQGLQAENEALRAQISALELLLEDKGGDA